MRLAKGLRLNDLLAAAAPKSSLIDDLVAYWPLGETSGTRNDVVGSNHLSDNNTVGYDTGKNGNAAKFVAANAESLTAEDTSGLSLGAAATWSYWLKPTTVVGDLGHIARWDYATDGDWSIQGFNDGAVMFVAAAANDPGNNKATLGAVFTPGTWSHVIWTYDGTGSDNEGRLKCYVDNVAQSLVFVGTIKATSLVNSGTATLAIGDFPGLTRYQNGLIDQVAIWSKVLTEDERAELYNSGNGRFYNATSQDFEE